LGKKTSILVVIVTFFIAVLITLWVNQSVILKYFLVRNVDKLSNGQLTLVVGSIDYNPFRRSIMAKALSIKTNDSTFDNSRSLPLQSLTFDSVVIQDFSLWKAIGNNIIKAGMVLTARPELIFRKSLNTIDTVANVESQIKFLSNYSPNTIIPMEFETIKLKYGTIEYNSDSSEMPLGSADFSIELHDFSTIDNSLNKDTNSFAFSKRIIIDVSNVSRKLKNGRVFRVKKIEFDSQAENLKVAKASLSGINKGVLDSIMIKNITLNGISIKELGNIEHISFNSILIDTSYISLFPQRRNKLNSLSYNKIADEIANYIKIFKVDTIYVQNLFADGFNESDNELIFGINGLNFRLNDLLIDSTSIANDLLPDYNQLLFEIDSLRLMDNINVEADNIIYSSSLSRLLFSNFKHITDSFSNNFFCKKIIVDDITLKKFFNNSADSNVSIKLIEPDINYSINDKSGKLLEMNDNEFLSNLLFRKIDIVNASVELTKLNEFRIISQKVNVNLSFNKNIALNSSGKTKYINELLWNTGYTEFFDLGNEMSLKLSSSDFNNHDLSFRDGTFVLKQDVGSLELLSVNWKKFTFGDFNFIRLVNDEFISTSSISLQDLNINIVANSTKKDENKEPNKTLVKIPLSVGFDKLNLQNSSLNLEIKHENFSQRLNTNFKLEFGRFHTDGLLDLEKILSTDINTTLRDVNFTDDHFITHADQLSFSTNDSTITINNIEVKGDSIKFQSLINGNGNLDIEEISLKDVHIAEISNNDKFHFKTLIIKNPNLSFEFEQDTNFVKSSHPKGLIPDFESFEDVDMSGLDLKLKLLKSNSEKQISFNNTDILWKEKNTNSSLDEIFLKMNCFNYFDDKNEVEIRIDNIFSDFENDDIRIKNFNYCKKRNILNSGLTIKLPDIIIHDFVLNKNNRSELEIDTFNSDIAFLKIEKSGKRESKFNTNSINESLSAIFTKFYIKDLKIENAGVQIHNPNDSIENLSELLDFQFEMHGFANSGLDTINVLPDYIKVKLKENSFLTTDSLYEYSAASIKYSFIDNSFIIDSISLMPTLDEKDYFKHFGYQTDRFKLKCRQITGVGFDLNEYIQNEHYLIDKVDFYDINTSIYRDKTYAFKHGVEKPMPAELIMKIRPFFSVDSLEIHNSRILYGEYVNKSSEPGEVFFDDFNLRASNITNIQSNIESNNSLDINISTKLMGKPKLTANINILLNEPNKFSFKGSTEEMDFSIFNSMTQNLFGISVIRGKGAFDLNRIMADDSIARGAITFKYKKLRIALYDREKAALNKGIASPFFKFLVNDLLIKSNNPRFIGPVRQGLVYYNRDEERSFLNYMWKSLVSGMMSTMWHNSKEQRKEKRRLKKIK